MATFSWLGGSGNWTDSNWSISGPSAKDFPGASDVAILGGSGAYTVTISGLGTQVHDVTLNDPSAELQLNTEFFITNTLSIDAGTVAFGGSWILSAGSLVNDGTILSEGLGANSVSLGSTEGFTNNGLILIDGDVAALPTFTGNLVNTGTIKVTDLGSLNITSDGSFENSGLYVLSNGGTLSLEVPSSSSTSGDIQFADGSASELILGGLFPSVPTTVEDFQPGNTIDLMNTVTFDASETAALNASAITVFDHGTLALTIPATGIPLTNTISVANNGAGWAQLTTSLACFAAGTLIRTPNGPRPVESLQVGASVAAKFAGPSPIKWVGRRRIDCRNHPDASKVWPVLVRQGAFSRETPSRDLWLSPDHAVFVGDVLIPIKYLVNDINVVRVPTDEITYFHIELLQHDVLYAEDLPAESFLPGSDKSYFENGGVPVKLHPNFVALQWEAEGCARLIVTGPELEEVRRRLSKQGHCTARAA